MLGARGRIVETASRLFYTQGYNSTGINQLIAEAGVAKASLYQYFPSKEDLLVEYLTFTAESTNKALSAIVDKEATPKAKVLALFDFLLKFGQQNDYQGCNFLNVASEIPKDNDRVRLVIKNQKKQIRALFAEILKPDGKESLADEMYLLFDAALMSSKVFGDGWPVQTARGMAERLLLC